MAIRREDLEAVGTLVGIERALTLADDAPVPPDAPEPEAAPSAEASPLARKLRIKPGMKVVVTGDAPEGVEASFEPLPEGATMTREEADDRGSTLWFVQKKAELIDKAASMIPHMDGKIFWIIWPKNAKDDLDRTGIREWFAKKGVSTILVASLDDNWACLWLKKRPKGWKADTESGFGPKKK